MEKLPKKIKHDESKKVQAPCMHYLRNEQTTYKCYLTNTPHARDAGAPDATCIAPDGTFVGIEFKKPKGGRQSKQQKEWQKEIEKRGGRYLLVHSLEELKSMI